ncbi:hypothetical protein Y1Q_0004722 [Alligator mississippiensis]|uniref:Uncharacterized protein n=1 Tax=Alligator mississippiensis TaxID=8496 RepID=A0A151NFN1_ALLMI|nr:hypothetical protein Y1Q_0004722 [Alligator mississippiensis]
MWGRQQCKLQRPGPTFLPATTSLHLILLSLPAYCSAAEHLAEGLLDRSLTSKAPPPLQTYFISASAALLVFLFLVW